MSWNGNDNKDPWGREAPPEIDEVIKKARERINSIFGGGSSSGGFSKKNFTWLFVGLILVYVTAGIYQVEQAERSVVLRLGKFLEIKGPGLHWNPLIVDDWTIVDVVRVRLQSYLNRYSTGLEVLIVNIEDSSPPNQVQEAFDDVIKAREDEVRARNEAETYANGLVPEARGEAQRMLQDAEAYREQVIAESEGDAARFNLLLAEYRKAPEVTRNRLYLDSIQDVMSNSTKVMIDVEGGNNILYLPLDKIAQSARGVEELNIPSTSNSSTSIRDLTNQVLEEIRRRQEERR